MGIAGYYCCERREVLPFLPQDITCALDIGCAAGKFGTIIKEKYGAEVWGVEYNFEIANEARKHLDHVLCGDCNDILPTINKKFDCITMLDVLEHLVSPESIIPHIKKLLSPKGVFIVTVPNILFLKVLYEMLIRKDFPYGPYGVLDKTHLRFFTKKSIVRFFSENQFNVVQARGLNPRLNIFLSLVISIFSLGILSQSCYLQTIVVLKNK